MKKGAIIALVVAIVLILIGGTVLVLGLSFAGEAKDTVTMVTESEISIQDSFDNVLIDTEDCNVDIVLFEGAADPHVVLKERDRTSHSVLVEDGTLKIRMVDNRTWKDHIGVTWESMEMTVYLPQKEYTSVRITTATGQIRIPGEFSAQEMVLRSDTGKISCVGVNGGVLDCMTSTGDISVRSSAPTLTKLQSSTGDLEVSVVAGDEMHLKTSTGDVDAEKVNAGLFTCSSSTGEVDLEGVLAEDYLQIRTDSGEVSIENCDAGRVDIETDTGDVEGHFLTPKWFSAHSDTGNIKVPNTSEGGECRIETDTGDIRFE